MDTIYTEPGLYDAVLPPYSFTGVDGVELDDVDLADRELDRLAPTPVRTALELGCGTGRITPRVAAHAHRLTCVDANAAMLAEFRNKRLGIEPVRADAAGFLTAAREESFDLVTAFWSLNYPLLGCFETTIDDAIIPQDPETGHRDAAALLTHLTGVLRPGGRLLIFYFDAASPEQQFVTNVWNRIAPFYGGRGHTFDVLTAHLRGSAGTLAHRHLPGVMAAETMGDAERWFLTGHLKQSPDLAGDPQVRDELRAFLTQYQNPPTKQAPSAAAANAPVGVRVPTGLHIITYTRSS